jgi:hypothetical protein
VSRIVGLPSDDGLCGTIWQYRLVWRVDGMNAIDFFSNTMFSNLETCSSNNEKISQWAAIHPFPLQPSTMVFMKKRASLSTSHRTSLTTHDSSMMASIMGYCCWTKSSSCVGTVPNCCECLRITYLDYQPADDYPSSKLPRHHLFLQ